MAYDVLIPNLVPTLYQELLEHIFLSLLKTYSTLLLKTLLELDVPRVPRLLADYTYKMPVKHLKQIPPTMPQQWRNTKCIT